MATTQKPPARRWACDDFKEKESSNFTGEKMMAENNLKAFYADGKNSEPKIAKASTATL